MNASRKPWLGKLLRYLRGKGERLTLRWDRATLPDFANRPQRLVFHSPRLVPYPERVSFGDDCFVGPDSSIVAMRTFDSPLASQKFESKITIGARFWATRALQVYAAQEIDIGDDVLIAANVFICDCQHGFQTATAPYKDQPLQAIAPIKIGQGTWLGQNVVVMPGVTIGDYVIVGANSVVTRSLPARTIAVGMPAKVIKIWDETVGRWVAVDRDFAS